MAVDKTVSENGCELTIRVSGRFDIYLGEAFRAAYGEEDLTATKVYVDLSKTDVLDSSALSMLLLLRKQAGGQSSIISLIGCRPDVREVLRSAQFEALFDIAL